MGFRGIIRDIICIYIGYKLLVCVITDTIPTSDQLILYAAALLIFSVWFMLERIGLLPKLM